MLTTNLSAVIACFNNIGPGFEAVGPTCINKKIKSSKDGLIFFILKQYPLQLQSGARAVRKSSVSGTEEYY